MQNNILQNAINPGQETFIHSYAHLLGGIAASCRKQETAVTEDIFFPSARLSHSQYRSPSMQVGH